MKCLLAAVNAKYIHSNLAVYSLKKYAEACGVEIEIAEYTINNLVEKVVQDIYVRKPDILAFSCYIWNISFIETVISDISKIMPQADIWLGGPEVSFECETVLKKLPMVKGIISGEGEAAFLQLMRSYAENNKCEEEKLSNIRGLVYRRNEVSDYKDKCADINQRQDEKYIQVNCPVEELDMDRLPFIYDEENDFENRIIYYESSRGCPFRCSYCLSSIDKKLRFRNIELVKGELKYFLDKRVPQVKFIDRTFNADKKRAFEIWKFIFDNDNGITNFHFEVSADLFDEQSLALLAGFRPGLVQLEVGIQSTCAETLREINRYVDFDVLAGNVKKIVGFNNIHCHVDLIAGLPYEDLKTFKKSFNDVYSLKAEQLQLGFLKVLKGSLMYDNAKKYGIVYKEEPPYEVLFTKWLSYEDILLLKGIEDMVEVYYNSGQFALTMKCLERYFDSAFDMFESLAAFYKEKYKTDCKHTRQARYEFLLEFYDKFIRKDINELRTILICDYYLRENARVRPAFAADCGDYKEKISDMYADSLREICGDERYARIPYRKLLNETHVEAVNFDIMEFVEKGIHIEGEHFVLFDYMKRSPLTSNAEMLII